MATFYIDPTGNDTTGNGSIGNPWASLYKACTEVSALGDIIHVNAGTYTEHTQCTLAADVSIEGVGDTSHIISHHQSTESYDALIYLESGSNSNQSISYIKLDGDSQTGYQAIGVYQRSNVHIHHCTIVDFDYLGVAFGGVGSESNSFHHNTLTNCGGQPGHTPNLKLVYQTDFLLYSNTITQTARSTNENGNCISGYEASYGMKIYDNTIIAMPYLNDYVWKFAIELWYQEGMEFYGNTVQGEVDFGKDVIPGGYDYGLYFHDNIIGFDSLQSVLTNGLQIEQTANNIIICRNIFKNIGNAVWFCQYHYSDDFVEDIWIYSNIFYNIGSDGGGWGIRFQTGSNEDDYYPPIYVTNINIWNNTIVADGSNPAYYGIELPTQATISGVSGIDIKNNIIIGFSVAGIYGHQQDNDYTPEIDGLTIQDNILYYNSNSNNVLIQDFTPTEYSNDGGIKENPSFYDSGNFDFHLSGSDSPAYHAGTAVSLPYGTGDYDYVEYNDPPSIGAYEYNGTPPTPSPTPSITPSTGLSPTPTPTPSKTPTPFAGTPTPSHTKCTDISIKLIAEKAHLYLTPAATYDISLRYKSLMVGFTTPDYFSEFCGWIKQPTPSRTPTQPAISYGIHTGDTYDSAAEACSASLSPNHTIYLVAGDVTPSVNDIFYNDNTYSNNFVGNNKFYYVRRLTATYGIQIDSDGRIVDVSSCTSITPTPTKTPTKTPTPSLSISKTPTSSISVTPSITRTQTPTPTPTTPATPFGIHTGHTYSNWNDACSDGYAPDISVYLIALDYIPSINDTFYMDGNYSTHFTGNGNWYYVRRNSDEWACQIDFNGVIQDVVDCNAPPSPTPTSTITPTTTPSLSISATPSLSYSVTPSPTHTSPQTPSPTPASETWGVDTSVSFETSTQCCVEAPTPVGTLYSLNGTNPLESGDYIFTNAACTIYFTGNDDYYFFVKSGVFYAVKIDENGFINAVVNCSSMPTTSITPTVTPTRTPSLSISSTPSLSISQTPSVTKTQTPTPTTSPLPESWGFHVATTYTTSDQACTAAPSPDSTKYTIYGNDPIEAGDYIYNNIGCTEAFNGDGNFYYVVNIPNYYAIQVNVSGLVLAAVDCSVMPTPSITPTRTPSISPTRTPSLSISATPSLTPTTTPSLSISATPSLSISQTPSVTKTQTPTPSTSPLAETWGFHVATTYSTSDQACTAAPAPDSTKYSIYTHDPLINGDVIYNDSACTTPFAGNSNYYYVVNSPNSYAVKVNGSGVILDTIDCSSMPTPSMTPTRTLSITPTRTPSLSISKTPSLSISKTPSLSISATPSLTPTRTPSLSISTTPSLSISKTPSLTATRTPTPSTSPLPEAWGFHVADTYSTSDQACTASPAPDSTKYTIYGHDPIQAGDYVYDDIACTNPFNGNGNYYYVVNTPNSYAIQVNVSGLVLTATDCSAMPTPSMTPTKTPSLSISVTPSLSLPATPSLTPTRTPTPSTGTAPCTASGIMGYWALEESSGTIYDATDNNCDSTAQSVTYGGSGILNNCLSFNGSSNYVRFGNVCQPSSALSISVWVKCGAFAEEKWVVENAGYDTGYCGYRLTITTANGWAYMLSNNDNMLDQYVSAASIHDNNWHHLCFTWAGGTSYYYTDGSKTAGGSWANTLIYTSPTGLGFGQNDLFGGNFYSGLIDEVGIWSRALTDAEVAFLYNGGSGRSCYTAPASPSPTPSMTPTRTPSLSVTSSPGGATPSISPTRTPSLSISSSVGAVTPSLSISVTPSLSISKTPSLSISVTPSLTPTRTPSLSISRTPSPSYVPLTYGFYTAGTYGTASEACAASPAPDTTLYTQAENYPPEVNDVFYTTAALSTPYNGNTEFYFVNRAGETWAISLNASGQATNVQLCSTITPTPTQTPSRTPSLSISRTPSLSISRTPSLTPTRTPSLSISTTPSLSISKTPSLSISATPSLSISKTPSLSITLYTVTFYASTNSSIGAGTVNVSYSTNGVDWTAKNTTVSSACATPSNVYSFSVNGGTTVYFAIRTSTPANARFAAGTSTCPTSYDYCGQATPYSTAINANTSIYCNAQVSSSNLVTC